MGSVNATPAADSYFASAWPTSNYAASTGDYLAVGLNGSSKFRAHARASLPSLPAGAVVTSATLTLTNTGHEDWGNGGKPIVANRSTLNTDAPTWNNHAYTTTNRSPAGLLNPGAGSTVDIDVTGVVKDWYGGAANYGFILTGDEVNPSARTPATLNNPTASYRWVLTVNYNEPPTAPTVTAPNGGEVWDASHTITWTAGSDPEGAALAYDIELTTDGGSTWSRLYTGLSGTSKVHDFSAAPASTACRIRIRATDPGGLASAWDESNANFTIQHNAAPSAPTLVAPANGSAADLGGGFTKDWTFSDPDAGDSQSAWAGRRKVSGSSTYEYWNAATQAWQGSIVWNGSSATEYAYPSGAWPNGYTYNWSVATKDAQGVAGPFATDFTVTAGNAPTVTVDGPSGTVTTTSRPVVAWTFFDADGDDQASYEVRVFSSAQYQAAGFDPATSAAVWDTGGVVNSATHRNRQVGVDLDNGGSYRAYVRAKDTVGVWSTWAYSAFTMSLTPPSPPTVTTTADGDAARVRIDVTGTHDPVAFPTTTYRVEFSDDQAAWTTVRGAEDVQPDGSLQAVVYDYEAPPGATRYYRARTRAEV